MIRKLMHKALNLSDDIDKLYIEKRRNKFINIEDYIKRARNTYDCSQQQYWKHMYKQKNNKNYETEIRKKTIIWICQVTNCRDYTREDIDMAMKEKSSERNWISYSKNQFPKD